MSINAIFVAGSGVLSVLGDALDNSITTSRDAAEQILVNGGDVAIDGGPATVANTSTIQIFGQDWNDTIALDESSGANPCADAPSGGPISVSFGFLKKN